MVLLGLGALLFCAATLYAVSQFETAWLQQVFIVFCGAVFAVALLLLGYGLYSGNIITTIKPIP
jgi:predicted tellurium resistance membrane protein TerC